MLTEDKAAEGNKMYSQKNSVFRKIKRLCVEFSILDNKGGH